MGFASRFSTRLGARFRTRRRIAASLSTLLIAAGLQLGGAGQATAAGVAEGPLFNNPLGTVAEQQKIRRQIQDLIRSAAPGSDIRVALYHMWDQTTAEALAAAHTERRVNVKVMLDSTSVSSNPSNPSYGILKNALGTDRTSPSFIGLCPQNESCLGDPRQPGNSINHNKFFLFSRVDGASDVVVQTSSNLTPSQYSRMWNDAMVLPDNPGMYGTYAAYFDDLARQDWRNWSYRTATHSPYKVYFYPYVPGSGNSRDTIWNILDHVTCTWKEGSVTRRSKVRVAVLKLTRQGVAEKLTSLQRAGCEVDVVYAETDSADGMGGTPGTWEALHAPGGPSVRCYNHDEDGDPRSTNSVVHSKYLLIDGMYYGSVNKVVWTGSHNYSGPALRENDEALLKVDVSSVHDAYVSHFNTVRSAAVPGTADSTPACKGVRSDAKSGWSN